MHPTLQTWVTSVTPMARATAVSLFAGFMFLGNGAGIFAASHILTNWGPEALFGIAAALTVVLTAIAVPTQRRHFLAQG